MHSSCVESGLLSNGQSTPQDPRSYRGSLTRSTSGAKNTSLMHNKVLDSRPGMLIRERSRSLGVYDEKCVESEVRVNLPRSDRPQRQGNVIVKSDKPKLRISRSLSLTSDNAPPTGAQLSTTDMYSLPLSIGAIDISGPAHLRNKQLAVDDDPKDGALSRRKRMINRFTKSRTFSGGKMSSALQLAEPFEDASTIRPFSEVEDPLQLLSGCSPIHIMKDHPPALSTDVLPPDNTTVRSTLISGRSPYGNSYPKSAQVEKVVLPMCDACGNPAATFLAAMKKKYHFECFRCMGCHDFIDSSTPFTFANLGVNGCQGQESPMHKACYDELFGKKCTVCSSTIPRQPNGKISYVKHPFFENEVMCPEHAGVSRRCEGCDRFEPLAGSGFADIGDGDRCVCFSCCRTLVVDNEDAIPLWSRVVCFFADKLQLPIWDGMRDVPILIVGQDTLSEQKAQNSHSGNSEIIRGLCLSEHHQTVTTSTSNSYRQPSSQVSSRQSRNKTCSAITAILCLSGLPSDLSASILAHEATHAWLKLHPEYNANIPIPPQVEEGCCQLVAYLILAEGLDPLSDSGDSDGPSDAKLRQYFTYSIESDKNEIYGEGFRKAERAYSALGIEVLLNHVAVYKSFPEL